MKVPSTALVVSLAFVLAACIHNVTDEDGDEAVLLFTGDVLLDRGVRPVAERRGIAFLFEAVRPWFDEADAVVVNLECPLTDTPTPVGKQYVFRGDARWASELRRVGVTHAALANNHTIDQSRSGLADTYQNLHEAGIVPLGFGFTPAKRLAPAVVIKKGLRIALFNAVNLPLEGWYPAEDAPDICQADTEQLANAVEAWHASHPHDRIAIVLHWGSEYSLQPSIRQRRAARRLADAGADLIVGHHPHVLQPIDTIGRTLVFYSLGNFVFDQQQPLTRASMMVRVHFGCDGLAAWDTIPVEIRQNRPVPESFKCQNEATRCSFVLKRNMSAVKCWPIESFFITLPPVCDRFPGRSPDMRVRKGTIGTESVMPNVRMRTSNS